MSTTIRKQKSGDQLTVGDWLAPGELMGGAAEVLFALAYPASADRSRDNDGMHVRLVVREVGEVATYSDVVAGTALFDLASDEDLAGYREAAERAQRIADLRAMADWLEAHPEAPLFGGSAFEQWHAGVEVPDAATGVARVRALAEQSGVKVEDQLDDRTSFTVCFGHYFSYQFVVWHKDGRPAEPAPEPAEAARSVSSVPCWHGVDCRGGGPDCGPAF